MTLPHRPIIGDPGRLRPQHAPRPPSHEAEATLNRLDTPSSGELPTYKPPSQCSVARFDPELDLRGIDLRRADLKEAKFKDVRLYRAALQLARLQDADLQDARLDRADLQGAQLQRARLQGCESPRRPARPRRSPRRPAQVRTPEAPGSSAQISKAPSSTAPTSKGLSSTQPSFEGAGGRHHKVAGRVRPRVAGVLLRRSNRRQAFLTLGHTLPPSVPELSSGEPLTCLQADAVPPTAGRPIDPGACVVAGRPHVAKLQGLAMPPEPAKL